MRLIDADELFYDDITDKHGNIYMVVHAPQIDNAPIVEAKPVVHGEWIEDRVETGDPFGNGYYLIDMLRCSVCGAFFDVSETRNFCSECGADMRGGKHD